MNILKRDKKFARTLTMKSLMSGFTLIELLVVVGILGMLVAVFWGQVTSGLLKSKDSAIKADLNSVQKSAVIEYFNLDRKFSKTGIAMSTVDCSTLSTANTMFANPQIQKALADVKNQNGGVALDCNVTADGTAYAIAVTLKTSGKYWCVDSTGVAKGEYGTGAIGYTSLSGANSQSAIWVNTFVCN